MNLKQNKSFTLPRNVAAESSFTLIELLVVIGILAILTAAVMLALNPVEYLKQTRDATRMSDLSSINQALSVLESQGVTSFGTANTVYVSLPDTTSTCANLGLPTLPAGYVYSCVTSANLQNTNGTGWIPVDFTQSPALSFSALPIDPINSTSTGNYYTYVTGGSWELDSIFESSKYRNNTQVTKTNLPGVYAIGSNKALSPIYSTSGLVGYWPLDEGSGTATKDASGNGNDGVLCNTGICPGTNPPTWLNGEMGQSINFVGASNQYVNIATDTQYTFSSGNMWSISLWFKTSSDYSGSTGGRKLLSKNTGGAISGYAVTIGNINTSNFDNKIGFIVDSSPGNNVVISSTNLPSANDGAWHNVAIVFDAKNYTNIGASIYFDGVNYGYSNSSVLTSGWQSSSNYTLKFGGGASGSTEMYSGQIDNVRIYNRALSAAEISAIYNSTK